MAFIWEEADSVSAVNLNNSIQSLYPVGSVYINASDDTNPSTLLGFGTWERFGEGRVLVSQDSGDGDFGNIGATGGSKTHQLTVNEMPSHSHTYTDHDRTGDQAGLGSGEAKTENTGSTGGNSPHNNLQPYITVYMWVRTA